MYAYIHTVACCSYWREVWRVVPIYTDLIFPLRGMQQYFGCFWCAAVYGVQLFSEKGLLDVVEIICLVAFILGNHLFSHWSSKMTADAELRKWKATWMCFLLHASFRLKKKTPKLGHFYQHAGELHREEQSVHRGIAWRRAHGAPRCWGDLLIYQHGVGELRKKVSQEGLESGEGCSLYWDWNRERRR